MRANQRPRASHAVASTHADAASSNGVSATAAAPAVAVPTAAAPAPVPPAAAAAPSAPLAPSVSSVVAAPPIEDMISVGAKNQEGLVFLIPSKSLSDYVPIYCSCKILYTSVRRDRPAAGVSARSREFGDRCGCH